MSHPGLGPKNEFGCLVCCGESIRLFKRGICECPCLLQSHAMSSIFIRMPALIVRTRSEVDSHY